METSGQKSSERLAVYRAFFLNVCIILYAVYKGSDLSSLAVALGAANSLVMSYVFGRSYVKSKRGEDV